MDKNKNKISWADMCDSDEESLGISTPKIVENINEEYINKKNSLDETISYKNILIKKENENTLGIPTPKIVENITEEYIKKEKQYIKDNKMLLKKHTNLRNNNYKKKKKTKCYTCKPERKVLKHIITPKINDKVTFHHDMWNRNIIIVTPNKHYRSLKDFPDNELVLFFRSIDEFCKNWNLENYTISYNNGEWKNHDHFHCKIKILEKIANRLRADFFRMQKLKKEYK